MSREVSQPGFLRDHENQYGQWWDFLNPVDRQVASASIAAGANANDDVVAVPFFLTGARAIMVLDAFCGLSVNSSGIDANNTSAWALTDLAGNAIATKTFTTDATIDTSYNMGAIAVGYLAANTGMRLGITNGTTADLNSAVCGISVGYADADHFLGGLKVVAPDGGTVSVADGVKGVLTMTPSDATEGDNDEIYLCTDRETIKFAAGKTYLMEAYIQFTEANTDDANIAFGCTNAAAANLIVDDGAGLKASGDYVAMWKVDGGTQWYCGAMSNGTKTPTAATLGDPATTAGGSSYQKLTIKVVCLTSTRAKATYNVDGVTIADIDFVYASATEQQVFLGAKNGTTSKETLNVDYLGYDQVR